jgi:hypothetical protein
MYNASTTLRQGVFCRRLPTRPSRAGYSVKEGGLKGRHHLTKGRLRAAFCVGIGRRLRLALARAPGVPERRSHQRAP